MAPGDLLPPGLEVDTSANTKVIDDILNTNWNGRFCEALTTLLVCPIFFDRSQYLQLAIKLAVDYRLGHPPVGPVYMDVYMDGFPLHNLFLNQLPRMVREMHMVNQSRGILLRDLKAIEGAWDSYAAKQVAQGEDLKSMK